MGIASAAEVFNDWADMMPSAATAEAVKAFDSTPVDFGTLKLSLARDGFAELDAKTPYEYQNTPERAALHRAMENNQEFSDTIAATIKGMQDLNYWGAPLAKPVTMAPAAKLEAGITMATGLVGSIGDSLTGSKPAPSAPSSAMDKLAGSSVEMGSLSKSFDATATPQKLDPIAKAYADLRSKDKKPGNDLA